MSNSWRRVAAAAFVETLDCTYVVNLGEIEQQQVPYAFRDTALAIWSRADGTHSETQITNELVEATGADRATVDQDVHAFLAQLLELGLIEEVSH